MEIYWRTVLWDFQNNEKTMELDRDWIELGHKV
jgi:hypothetical protein